MFVVGAKFAIYVNNSPTKNIMFPPIPLEYTLVPISFAKRRVSMYKCISLDLKRTNPISAAKFVQSLKMIVYNRAKKSS